MTYWNQLSRLQRNIIIVVISGLCIILLLWIPSIQGNNDYGDKEYSANHIQITPIRDQSNNDLTAIDGGKRNKNEDDNEIDLNNGILGVDVAENGKAVNSVDSNNVMANNVIDNVENVRNNAIDAAVDVPKLKEFKGPTNDRQRAVVAAARHAWTGYKKFAWGHDNLKPISMGSHDWFGLGLTIVDALDTLYIMNMQEEYEDARNWVDLYLKLDVNRDINLFEVTIRVLGGLLGAYHLSGDKMFLTKATELGNRLMPAFSSPSGIPYSDVNLATMVAHSPKWSPDSSTSEVTTIQLEFRDLSRITNDPTFENAINKINEKVHNLEKKNGLVPIFINANTGMFRNFATISLGARGDSYYEYLLKQWVQTGKKTNDFLIEDYIAAIDGVIEHLVRRTPNEKYVYIGELINGKDFKPKMDHLTCFLPGTLLLGYTNGMPESHLHLAQDLMETCYQMYAKQQTFLAPEIVYFNLNGESETDIYVKSNDAHNLLRPEFIESLYYFYSLTGNTTYQDMGWTIFNAFEKYTKVKNGYTSIGNVKNALNTRPRDMMESFYLGEMLKYFYLLFSDDRKEIDLEKFVFNSEAHAFPIGNN
ncbi:endoplasmic reticulum mannosyl-oligosaccharide 1,2-alpha-mannosidase isoform X2 [Sitodiplosis mosellana]|uniref:endoplasmic reticulum mannosyl-oligosaccharide 1,2-alpha-mannosidase isoform X2 n=1 Tax=Sitodiplosis mosellana TaxID=263140 RepID=UPI002443CE08|nr:endoplasmic reticulum mannosyl-oligosaccharide 1,2-alpha-mannosidase isoform X2 [Sitodiplosis mosellana]